MHRADNPDCPLHLYEEVRPGLWRRYDEQNRRYTSWTVNCTCDDSRELLSDSELAAIREQVNANAGKKTIDTELEPSELRNALLSDSPEHLHNIIDSHYNSARSWRDYATKLLRHIDALTSERDLAVAAKEQSYKTMQKIEDCFWLEKKERMELRAAIEGAPHTQQCDNDRHTIGRCSCWKAKALDAGE